jgi:hypothetical protein
MHFTYVQATREALSPQKRTSSTYGSRDPINPDPDPQHRVTVKASDFDRVLRIIRKLSAQIKQFCLSKTHKEVEFTKP